MFHAGPAQMYFPRSRGFWRFAFWLLFRASGAIICNLESVKAEIVKYGVSPDKVHPIFSVAYEPEELPVPLSEKVEAFLQSHEPRLFSYTLFRPEFTRECLFQAFAGILKHYPNAGLLIAGPREVPDEVRAEMKKWGVEDRIHVAGNMDHAQFLTAIQRSVVSIRTHLRDGLCASVLEALELGVPVVAAEDGQRPASVITYAPADAADLQAKLLEVLANPSAARAKVILPQLHKGLDEEISVLLRAAGVKHGIPKRVAT